MCRSNFSLLPSIEAFEPRYPGVAVVRRLFEELSNPAVGQGRPETTERNGRACPDIVQRAGEQHALARHAAADLDLAAALGIPDLDPFPGDAVEDIDTHAGATRDAVPFFGQDTAALIPSNRVRALQHAGGIVHFPVANPEIERCERLVVRTRVGLHGQLRDQRVVPGVARQRCEDRVALDDADRGKAARGDRLERLYSGVPISRNGLQSCPLEIDAYGRKAAALRLLERTCGSVKVLGLPVLDRALVPCSGIFMGVGPRGYWGHYKYNYQ